VLLLAPAAALVAAAVSREPLLANWTQTFMGSAAQFVAQFFPIFLLGAVFGKLMEDSGSVTAIAQWMTERLGAMRAMLAVVLAGALVTYGGVSLFVAFFVLAPMAEALFRGAAIPRGARHESRSWAPRCSRRLRSRIVLQSPETAERTSCALRELSPRARFTKTVGSSPIRSPW